MWWQAPCSPSRCPSSHLEEAVLVSTPNHISHWYAVWPRCAGRSSEPKDPNHLATWVARVQGRGCTLLLVQPTSARPPQGCPRSLQPKVRLCWWKWDRRSAHPASASARNAEFLGVPSLNSHSGISRCWGMTSPNPALQWCWTGQALGFVSVNPATLGRHTAQTECPWCCERPHPRLRFSAVRSPNTQSGPRDQLQPMP